MRKLFCLFSLFAISLSASASSEWLYYKNYPWVYDNVSKDWLYLRGSSDGEVYAYRNSTKEWEEFSAPETEKTWEEKYEEWIQNPEPYGGVSVLQQIKEAKYSGATYLLLYNKYISDLTPIAGLTNLMRLSLALNNITDITPLAELTNLLILELFQNNISDLTPLEGLTNLTELILDDNNISNLSPLEGLTNLTYLTLYNNPISASQKAILKEALPNTYISWPDVIIDDSVETEKTWDEKYEEWILDPEPYGGLEALQLIKDAKESGATELHLGHNNISDVTPLAELTNLKILWLYDNNISDVTPLAGLTNLTLLTLDNNIAASQKAMLKEALQNTHIQWTDPIIDDDEPTEKSWDEKYEEWILDPEPYGGLEVLQQIKDAKENGPAYLGNLTSTNISDLSPLAELTDLTDLWLYSNLISDITPLAGLTNLKALYLGMNPISDITPLAGLTNLEWLGLSQINISDITPLAGLTNLEWLDLFNNNISASQKAMLEEALPNTIILWPYTEESKKDWEEKYQEWIQNPEPYGGLSVLQEIKDARERGDFELYLWSDAISDITPLAGLTNLAELSISGNNISDLTPLTGLTNLISISLSEKSISDITLLAGLTNLERLSLYDNNISDITPLAGLTNLTRLDLTGKSISDLTPLAGLTNLTELSLDIYDNNISDLTPLAGLTNLEWLYLGGNDNLSDLTPLAGLTNLEWLNLWDNNITASQKAMLEEALPNTYINWPHAFIEDRPWYLNYDVWISDPEPYGGIEVLQKIKEAKESEATELDFSNKNISDLTPLAGLTNLTVLDLSYNNISNLTPLAGLTNLRELELAGNPITASQKAMLEKALPNTDIQFDW
jgi:internalin A